MKMDERKQRVLLATILDYIATADPVGSRTIARKYNLGVSPATVRNEMSDLEEMGYLEQPHTSAGRIPSQLGYRYYVDFLMKKEPIEGEIRDIIYQTLLNRIRETDELISLTSKLLSQLTNYTAFILAPFCGENTLRHIKLLPIEEGKAVVIIVLDSGHVEHRIVEVPGYLNEGDYAAISAILNGHLQGLTLEQWHPGIIQAVYRDLDRQRETLKNIIEVIEQSLDYEHEQKVFLKGTLNILDQPEFKQIERVKALFELFEEEDTIKNLLHSDQENGIVIKIGTENRHESMKGCSLVTATYHRQGKVIGNIGLLGPTRMEYSRAVSILELVTYALTDMLEKMR